MSERAAPVLIAIAGSPRHGGNTDQLLEAACEGARREGAEVHWLRPSAMQFAACLHCGGCNEAGVCVLRDDMTPVYDLIERMDGLLLASPIFFASVTAQVKALIDRAQPLWVRKHLLGRPLSEDGKPRPVLFLSALGGSSPAQIEATRHVVRDFTATFDGDYRDLIFPSLEAAGEAAEHWTALPQAHEAGAALVAELRGAHR